MKKYLTLSNILACLAFVLAVVSFAFMFTDQLQMTVKSILGSTTSTVSFSDTFFSDGGSIVGFIGYLLVLVGALAACFFACPSFLKKKNKRFLVVALCSLVVIAGGVLILLEPVFVNSNTGAKNWNISGLVSGSEFQGTVTAILAGVFGIVSGLLSCAGAFLAKK